MSTKPMNPRSIDFSKAPGSASRSPVPRRAAFVLRMLGKLRHGSLRVELPNGVSETCGDGMPPITLRLKSWQVFDAALKSGDIGFAQAFIDGHWSTDNLPGLLELLVRNREALESVIYGNWWGRLLYRMRHLVNRNSKSGSRRNIHAHYDLGNDFYRLWLDATMSYSSALFSGRPDESLEAAQRAKYRRILDELRIHPGARVLELGCGWGGFAEMAACEGQARVTGVTLSTAQLEFARQWMVDIGVADLVELQLRDYRDTDGSYDAIASIEMFEAVGEAYWPDYFHCIARNLKQGGRACIQTIVIADQLFDRYRKGTDFIQQYIFPGGMLPSPSAFVHEARKHGLQEVGAFAFGADYARTLAAWRKAFREQLPRVRALGFDERFVRTWEFYLAYCEAGFRAGSIDVMQFTLEKT